MAKNWFVISVTEDNSIDLWGPYGYQKSKDAAEQIQIDDTSQKTHVFIMQPSQLESDD